MNEKQWNLLLDIIAGNRTNGLVTGFIIDSPWLPGWYGIGTLDYYTSDQLWFEANKKAIETFPETIFLPGFWAEYGMCTEPSAFGAKCRWEEMNLPHAEKLISDIRDLSRFKKPNPKTDGLLPFVLNRLRNTRKQIEEMGHKIKFAVARGPLNIASFLVGTTELMMAMITDPQACHGLIGLITDFLVDWIGLQMEQFTDIEGIFLLDDIIGFVGDAQSREYVMPYFKKIYGTFDAKVNFLHNDAAGLVCAPYLSEIGVNLFNFSFEHSIGRMQELTQGKVTLLGNIPPRDVLQKGTCQTVREAVIKSVKGLKNKSRIILSCGGGIPQGVGTENIQAFIEAANMV